MINFANAKINLGLNITGKRPDGYHNLETIFYPIPVEDALEVHVRREGSAKCRLYQTGFEIDGDTESNLVVKAYRLLDEMFDLPRVDIFLVKHIPSGAGLGGGSSDAACMLKLLNKKFRLGLDIPALEECAARLGADCAFFIRNKPTYAEGIGNLFSPVSVSLKGYQLWLVQLDIFVSTREAFSQIKPHAPERSLKEIIQLPIEQWRGLMKNDFEESVFAQHPAIAEVKAEMYRQGAIYASMSGSGSTVYSILGANTIIPLVNFGRNVFVYEGKFTI